MDLSLLSNLMGGDRQLVDRFVSIFKTQVPGQVAALSELCEAGEWEALSTALHSLKTQFSYVGLPALADQLRGMEEQADHGDTASIAQQILAFTADFHQFWESAFPAH
nr:Hpt domain-containing protein [uncultured Dyadobacter sp.]